MLLWNPSPPQGFSSGQGQVIIGRPIIPLIEPPQGIGGAPAEPVTGALVQKGTLSALVQKGTLSALVQKGTL